MSPVVFSLLLKDENQFLMFLEKRKRRRVAKTIKLKIFRQDELRDDQFDFNFRFTRIELQRLKVALVIPNKIVCMNGSVCGGLEGLCILLRRMVYPNRLGDLVDIFHRTKSELSMIIRTMMDYILDKFGYLVSFLRQYWLAEPYIKDFAEAIQSKGVPLQHCWVIIDGTIRGMRRPGKNQRIVYNGHKRKHSLKFQSIVTPNGLIAHLFGPIEGRRHDSYLLTESKILPKLEQMKTTAGISYYVYGDPAYPLRPQLQGLYKNSQVTPQQAAFNKAMSSVRVSVEWEFGKIAKLFAFVDFKQNLKLYVQPVAKYYQLCAILTNCQVCLNGSQTSQFYGLNLPTLEKYSSNIP